MRWWLAVSGLFLLVQMRQTDYAEGGGAGVVWFLIGAALLVLVLWRRSRVARVVLIIAALFGAALFGIGAFESQRSAILTVAYLGQALPLMAPAVRRHVHTLRYS